MNFPQFHPSLFQIADYYEKNASVNEDFHPTILQPFQFEPEQ